ncbi:MAG: hypothetical protein Roseis2KO_32810 [Roseivirga sp.]
MQHSKGPCGNCAHNQQSPPNEDSLSPEDDFIQTLQVHGFHEMAGSLKLVHDIALYHSDYPIETGEKSALNDLRVIWEGLSELKTQREE